MIDLSNKNEEEESPYCDHILMIKEEVGHLIDLIAAEHPGLMNYEVMAGLDLLKFDIYADMTRRKRKKK